MEVATCVLCQEPKSTEQLKQCDINLGLTDQVFTVVCCDWCGLLYLNPRPTAEEIHAYYPPQYYPLGGTVHRKAIDRVLKRFSKRLKKAIREQFMDTRRHRMLPSVPYYIASCCTRNTCTVRFPGERVSLFEARDGFLM